MSNEAIDWAIKWPIIGNAPRKLILLLLANRADEAWECWPSMRLLAEEAGISMSQARRHVQALEEEDGVIRRVPWQRNDGSQGANGYILGPEAPVTPHAFTRRGGGHTRVGGLAPTTGTPARVRGAKNPQGKPTEKPSSSAAREESRRRSLAGANEAKVMVTEEQLWRALNTAKRQKPDDYNHQIETIRSRAPKLWRDAKEKAVGQLAESDPEKLKDPGLVDNLAYQYVIRLRKNEWPAWLLGSLLPYISEPAGSKVS